MGQSESQSIYEVCLAAIQLGDLAQAQALLQPLLATGKDAEALRLQALIEVRQNEPAKAVAMLRQALRIEQNPVLLANLANALVYAGDHAAAETVCRQSLAMEALPEVCNTLGSLLAMRKAYQEAVVSFEQALALRPDYTQARCNLANANFLSGNIERAFEDCFRLIGYDAMPRQSFEDALTAIAEAIVELPSLGLDVINTIKELAYAVLATRQWTHWSEYLANLRPSGALHYEAMIRLAITYWLNGHALQLERALHKAGDLRKQGIGSSKGLQSLAAYERYLVALHQTQRPAPLKNARHAVVLGDSHVLSWNGQPLSWEQQVYPLEAELIMGAKAFHIADAAPNRFKWRLLRLLENIPSGTPLLFSFGEIDCRLDGGLLPFIRKTGASLTESVKSQTAAYAKAVCRLLPKDCPAAWLIGVPAPNIASLQTTFPNTDAETFAQLKEIIRQWNASLQVACQSLGLGFVDVYGLTVDANGVSNGCWHCDGVHLLPEALKAAHWIAPATAETPEALNAQGAQLAEQKRYAEAEECFLRALALRPDYVDARINLSAVQFLGCKPEMAWAGTLAMLGYPPELLCTDGLKKMGARILEEGFGGQAGQFNTLKKLAYNGLPVRDWAEWNQLLSRPRNRPDLRHEGAVRQAITAWLQQTPAILEQALTLASTLRDELPQNKSNRNLVAFANYLGQLQQRFPQSNRHGKKLKPLRMQALGDSHVLSWHGLVVQNHKSAYAISAELVMGAKAFHMGHSQRNHYQDRLKRMLAEVPADTALLLSCGEIDCRLTEGLMPFLQKTGQAMEILVTEQVTRYVRAITLLVTGRRAPVWLTGVPAPLHKHLRLRHPDFDEAVWQRHVDLIRQWNQQLAKACAEAGYGFVDLYALTAEPDGTASGQWHCDSVHLLPTALQAAPWIEPQRPPTAKAIAGFAAQANQALAAHRLADAERVFRQVIALGGALPEAHNNLGSVLKEQGRLGEAQAAFEQAVALRPDYASAHSNWLFTLQYAPGQTLAKLRAAHEDWARQQLQGITPADPASFERKGDGPIVVGLVSPDLYAHPVGVFLLPWLERHDRGRFQLIAYADSERDDPFARRIRAGVEGWRSIAGQDDEAVAKQIAADRVDILIDLAGHTAGNRLKLFARRVAPVQVSWLGYSATTGVPAMDVVLMDAYTAPPGVEEGFTEQLERLDGLRFCYTPPEYAPAVSPAPILRKGHVTFGSFNNLAKVTPKVIETWAAILKSVPNAQLVLKWKSLGDAETRERLVATFVQHGIDAARIDCRGWSSHPQMLAEYGEIDIALDPFPFSGGLTSCDALYMGVPVLTLPGELPISRQTGSFLDALGLHELIAKDRVNYQDIAITLANNLARMICLRENLRERMLRSVLCDGHSYAKSIEKALKRLVDEKRPEAIVPEQNRTSGHLMTAAIYYQPEAYTTSGPKLMGRNAAGESFLRGFLSYSQATEFWAQVQQVAHARHFAETVQAYGRNEPVKAVDKNSLGALAGPGVCYYPGPGIGEHAFQRAAFGHGAWSLCGITHTTSSAGAMDALAELITAPVQPWDAVICTSTAVKNNVERLLQAQVDYLKDRLGISKLVLPQLPVIPLGIHTQDFAYTDEQKAAARQALGVTADTLVVLFMGRLSFHAKAHPLAMYQALEAAAKATGKEVVLVECGWHANEFIEKAYADAAKLACPSVKVITLDGRKAEGRLTAWAGADVFCSLSDNIQETFGIVPIEAMAASLPVVVADWDGYKDTVRDGIDGFRIPTLMPGAGLGTDLALRHALEIDTYDMYCGHTCSLVAVDVQATAQAFAKLFESPELRQQMGEAGRQRARAVYDWAAIIPQYEALWAQLGEIRKQANDLKPLPHPWPARMDPFHAFAAYPTQTLTEQTVLGLVDADTEIALKRTLAYRQLAMVDFAKVVLPSEAEIRLVLQAAAAGPKAAVALIADIPAERQPFVFRSLAWLVKLGVLKVCS